MHDGFCILFVCDLLSSTSTHFYKNPSKLQCSFCFPDTFFKFQIMHHFVLYTIIRKIVCNRFSNHRQHIKVTHFLYKQLSWLATTKQLPRLRLPEKSILSWVIAYLLFNRITGARILFYRELCPMIGDFHCRKRFWLEIFIIRKSIGKGK